jgi:hypothetical protein
MKKVLYCILAVLFSCAVLLATQPSYDGVNHVEASNTVSTLSDHIDSGNLPNATTLGKYIVAHTYMCSTDTAFCSGSPVTVYTDTVTDNHSNTYNACVQQGYPIGGPYTERWDTWVAKVTTAGTTTVTGHNFSGGNAYGESIMVYEVDLGVTDANPCDKSASDYVASQVNTNHITSAALTASNEWIDCWFGNGLPSTSFGAPVTLISSEDTSSPYQRVAGGVASSSAAQTCTINYTGTSGTEMAISVLKAAAAAGGGSSQPNLLLTHVGH